ncbi:diacylglycerol kinase family protein [Streptomyces sp. WMMC500]|uniref:diacylglycerol kinase family protein n=1 Tax=Streptomyces sp. WMMC500 TaxID=3015154 RepID=UPI00248C96C9|nr:diacylglycerol kinase family protein [Streptomyces sp. WMMC500]WBB64284.1 diacylglycerol kinase family protein [Streptomyces sp. WMMC500]
MSAPDPTGRSLLVLIDPAARRADGEAVRIARDVLSAAAATKICLPESAPELARALARRGARRPVVIGDDRAFLRVVGELRRQETLADAPLALVPVGTARTLAATLGVPTGTVDAARTVLDGEERRLGLLVDDRGGVVLDALRLPAQGLPAEEAAPGGPGGPGAPEPAGAPGPADAHRPADDHRTGPGPRTPGGAGLPEGAGTPGGAPGGTPLGGLAGLTQRVGPAAGGGARKWTPAAGLRALAARAVAARAAGQRNEGVREPAPPPVVTQWGAEDATGGWESGGADGTARTPPGGHGTEEADGAGWAPAPYDEDTAEDEADPAPENGFRLRVEADGVLLADLDGRAAQVRVVTDPTSGLARVVIRPRGPGDPLHTEARSVRVWGSDFRYRADALLSPPVRQRTWTAHPNAWSLITAPTR